MASSSNELGYEDDRFANHVSQNFHCPICLNVLKDPVMCRRNQHHFCIGCITRHLENSKTCPTCMDELTVETLSQAPRIYTSCLSELRIRCDYFYRGCPDFVELGNLKTHVDNCGFSPVVCSNEGCNMEINKLDIIHHETEVCELRKVMCHECVKLRKEIHDVKLNQTEMKASLTDIKANLTETRENLSDMNDKIRLQMRCMQDEIVNKVEAMMKPAVAEESGVKEAVLRQSQDPTTDTRRNIIVAGGEGLNERALKSVEMFCWSTKAWIPLKRMKTRRQESSSFVYKKQMFVAGGLTPQGPTNTMEAMNFTQDPAQWLNFPARLPTKFCGHKNVVYQDRLFVIGGYDYNANKDESSDAVYEVCLVSPYPIKLLYQMPFPRAYHGVELHNGNIFIAGGTTTGLDKDSIASIAKYDVVKNEYREVAKLPFAVNDVASVIWRSYMLVLGGVNEKGEVVNTVVVYDIEKEECHTLPSMKYKRSGCIAVVSGDLIVVMGGYNSEEGFLKSAECFDFSRYSWEELPAMLKPREWATACCC